MKGFIILVLLCGLSSTCWAQRFDGNKLMEFTEDNSTFTEGMFAGYVYAIAEILWDGTHICHGAGVTVGQYMAVTEKYLNDNPELWNQSATTLVIDALQESFPCEDDTQQ